MVLLLLSAEEDPADADGGTDERDHGNREYPVRDQVRVRLGDREVELFVVELIVVEIRSPIEEAGRRRLLMDGRREIIVLEDHGQVVGTGELQDLFDAVDASRLELLCDIIRDDVDRQVPGERFGDLDHDGRGRLQRLGFVEHLAGDVGASDDLRESLRLGGEELLDAVDAALLQELSDVQGDEGEVCEPVLSVSHGGSPC